MYAGSEQALRTKWPATFASNCRTCRRSRSSARTRFSVSRHLSPITYTEITSEGKLRHPSFEGLRELAENVDVFELKK